VRPAPDEVADYAWVPWSQLRAAAQLSWAISPWAAEQVPLLDRAGIGHQS
jgi:isopentenyl-diphosphate delta-isomerase